MPRFDLERAILGPILVNPIHDSTTTRTRAGRAAIALTLLAPALGGSTELWAQSVLAIAAGLLMLAFPPRRSLGLIPNLLLAALLLIAISAFLPAQWFALPDWKIALLKIGASLPSTRSPQPWLTLQWTFFLVLGLAWSYYLVSFPWSRHLRRNACIAIAFAILVLSGALTFAFVTKQRIPFWPVVDEFGFFPNRNQTSNVLGLGAVMIYAIGLQQFQEGRRYWWCWFASLSFVCWALILNYSRAGIILFFAGALAVHVYWWITSRDRRQALVAFGGLILLIALFLVDGGATLMRFGKESANFFEAGHNLRFAIYHDAINLIAKSSPFGIGLGNFWPIFAVNRHYSATEDQTAHPESDWLWSGVDLGWVGIIVAVAIFVWWVTQCPPFTAGTNRLLRVAALICGIAFALHGVLDVSGHRLGALWPALLFGSIAINPENGYRESKTVARLFRLIGLLLVGTGIWWLCSFLGFSERPPTTATVEHLQTEADRAIEMEDFHRAIDLCSEGLRLAPLDWNFYMKRGLAEAREFESRASVLRDFSIAQYLLPNWPALYLEEGSLWVDLGEPDLAVETWAEGMHRMPQTAHQLYANIFGVIQSDPELRERWRQLADHNKKCLITFLRVADGTEFQIELQQLLEEDEYLRLFNDEDLKLLFALWYEKGDKLWLAETLQEHPDWKKIAWPQLAHAYVDYQDYRQAFETASQFLVSSVPNTGSAETANSPITEAQSWAEKKDWQKAWRAIAPLVPAP